MSRFSGDGRMALGVLGLAILSVVVALIAFYAAPEADAQNATHTEDAPDVSTQSLTPKASFASATGANRLVVQVSNHGNLLSFESPAGQEAVLSGGNEGYAVCSFSSAGGDVVHGHDTGSVEAGFGAPTFAQPNGSGTFPLTVTRNTTDGKFQLKQVWARPDTAEKDVTLTMTLKNTSNATSGGVTLSRSGNYDVGTSAGDAGGRTGDSVWLWDDFNGLDSPPVGARMTALSFGTPHRLAVESRFDWAEEGTGSTRRACETVSEVTPAPDGFDYAMRVNYDLGSIGAGASKTVRIGFGRM